MTIDEAKKIIATLRLAFLKYIVNDTETEKEAKAMYKYADACKMAEIALDAQEYRTPKKVLHDSFIYSDGQIETVYGCPTCEVILPHEGQKYCWHCGQALDWSNWVKDDDNVRCLVSNLEK